MFKTLKRMFHRHTWITQTSKKGFYSTYYDDLYGFENEIRSTRPCIYKIEKCSKCGEERGMAVLEQSSIPQSVEYLKAVVFG